MNTNGRWLGSLGAVTRHQIRTHCLAWCFLVITTVSGVPAQALEIFATGFNNPRGLAFGPDGALYVAEAGTGGSLRHFASGQELCIGQSGAITRVTADDKQRTVRGLSSHAPPPVSFQNQAVGLQDIAFVGDSGYAILGWGFDMAARDRAGRLGSNFGQLIRWSLDGSYENFADITAYEASKNPDGGQIASSPSALIAHSDDLIVLDASAKSLLQIAPTGDISTLAVFTSEAANSVPTSLSLGPDGAYYVGLSSGFPVRTTGTDPIYRVVPGKPPTVFASGFTNVSDLAFDHDGNLLVLEMLTNGIRPPRGKPGGSLIRLARDGSRETLESEGLVAPTGLLVADDGAIYISNQGMAAREGQIVKLPAPITFPLGDYNRNGQLDAADLDLQANAIATQDLAFDLTGDGQVNYDDRLNWVNVLRRTWIGDSNLDGQFSSTDFVAVFTVGKFEKNEDATWVEGDWNGDKRFGSSDFVAAFQEGGFEKGPRAAVATVVPEPSSWVLVLGLLSAISLARPRKGFSAIAAMTIIGSMLAAPSFAKELSIARLWNEQLLDAIRNDTARPTVHARNLYHVSAAMFDAWAAYDPAVQQVLHNERAAANNVTGARDEAISYAAYQVLRHRFVDGPAGTGPGKMHTAVALDELMRELGYDPAVTSTVGDAPAALGNRIGRTVIQFGLSDGANEANNYGYLPSDYTPVNSPLTFDLPGATMADPNRWQPLHFLRERRDQFGNIILQPVQSFLSPYWGNVKAFALTPSDRSPRGVYLDQGPPPLLNGPRDDVFRASVNQIVRYSSVLDPNQSTLMDISPASRGNSPLGTYEQHGHSVNPYTGKPYTPQMVKYADWARVIAEFWADGPESEAPPGHWNVIGNHVSDRMDQLGLPKRVGGQGPVVDNLEWDVKMYLSLNGAVHDAGVAAWNHKGVYDYSRPISMIRYMGQLGQSSDPNLTVEKNGQIISTYHPDGLTLEPGLVEVITSQTSAPGNRHAGLAGHEGEIAIFAWQGPPAPPIATADSLGRVGWMLASEWLPYQRDDFVTPPFAAYLSGHSTFSRAAAEVMTRLTGDQYFPGGLFEYEFLEGTGLEFEYGPSSDLTLQWATYYDAADEAGLSRLYGGIHVPADDLPGRLVGSRIGAAAWEGAQLHFVGVPEPSSAVLLGVAAVIARSVRVRQKDGRQKIGSLMLQSGSAASIAFSSSAQLRTTTICLPKA